MNRSLAVLVIAACGDKREPPPAPVPPPIAIDAAAVIPADAPAAPGSILHETPLAAPPDTLVVRPDAIYFSAVTGGVYKLRDGKTEKLDDKWTARMVGDDEALFYVAKTDDDTEHLVRLAYDGTRKQLVPWNGWVKAIDATHVYLEGYRTRTSVKVPKLGGAPVKLPCKSGLAVDDDFLYCLERTEFVRYDKLGKGRSVLGKVAFGRLTEGPVVTAKYVYASTEGADKGDVAWSVVRVAKGGGSVEIVAPDVGNIYDLVAAEHEAYWIENKDPSPRKMVVRRMADTGRIPIDFAEGFGSAQAIAVTASMVFVADSDPARVVELKR